MTSDRINQTMRARLLGSACLVMALGASQGFAQTATVNTTGNDSISHLQVNGLDGGGDPVSVNIGAVTGFQFDADGDLVLDNGEPVIDLDPTIFIDADGAVTGDTLTVRLNTASSTATGNLSGASVTTTTNADPGTTPGSTSADQDGTVTTANVPISITQVISGVSVTDRSSVFAQTADDMGITGDAVTNSTLTVSSNVQEAVGAFNDSTVSTETTANATGVSSGISSSQAAIFSDLDVTTTASADIVIESLTESTAVLTGNEQRSIARGNIGDNSQTVTANDLEVTGGTPASATLQPLSAAGPVATASGGYATSSAQYVSEATINSTVIGGEDAGFAVAVGGEVASSTITNDANTASAVARSGQVNNETTIVANTIGIAGSGGTVATIGSVQFMDDSFVTATAMGDGGGVDTNITESATLSTVTTSGNRIEALATGNIGANSLSVTANSGLDTSGTDNGSAVVSTTMTGGPTIGAVADAAFSISSLQVVDSNSGITASLVDDVVNPTSGAAVSTVVGADIKESTVRSDENILLASATGNLITAETNSINVNGNSVATTTSIANLQGMGGDLTAVVGSPGTPAIPGASTDETISGAADLGVTFAAGTGDFGIPAGASMSLSLAPYSDPNDLAAVSAFLTSQGFLVTGTNAAFTNTTGDPITLNLGTNFNAGNSGIVGTTITLADFSAPSTPPVPGPGGVTITAGGSILGSTVTVDGNISEGAVTGNEATNRIRVSASELTAGGDLGTSTATLTSDFATPIAEFAATASADHALTNVQTVGKALGGASDLTTAVSSEFAILTEGGVASEVTNSTLSVSSNNVFATTRGNVVTNEVSLSATNLADDGEVDTSAATGAALLSSQGGIANVVAESNMFVSAPAAILTSTLNLDANRSQAVATMNEANNTVSVDATNLVSISSGVNAELTNAPSIADGLLSVTADNVLLNQQTATTSVTAEANTSITNLEAGVYATPVGIASSTVTVDRNVTLTEAMANRSSNLMVLEGGSASEVTGGVLNSQSSTANVTARTSAIQAIVLEGGISGSGSPMTFSSLTMDGNVASGLATGNQSSNVLNAAALNTTASDGQAVSGLDAQGTSSVSASYGVLNLQDNSGDVSSLVSASYGAQMVTGGTMAINDSRVSVGGNLVRSTAVGNRATNSLTVSALNQGDATAAIGSTQTNAGNITAAATASIGVNTTGDIGSSTVGVSGNTISSSAVGNRASSSLVRN